MNNKIFKLLSARGNVTVVYVWDSCYCQLLRHRTWLDIGQKKVLKSGSCCIFGFCPELGGTRSVIHFFLILAIIDK